MEKKKVEVETKEGKKDTEKEDTEIEDTEKTDIEKRDIGIKDITEFTEVYKSALLLALLKNDLITKEEYQWCLEQLKN